MPSFPTSVFAPSNKSAGQTIQAAHINDAQDEIVAIESGYRTGTAPLNSSGSTVTSLSVAGGSTFGSRPVMPPPDAVRVTLDDAAAIPAASTTPVSWTKQTFATNSSIHSTATDPHRLTPQSTGIYWCHAGIEWQTRASTDYDIRLEDSSGTQIARVRYEGSSGLKGQNISGLKRFDSVSGSTQWVRLVVQVVGSTNSVSTGSFFEMVKL